MAIKSIRTLVAILIGTVVLVVQSALIFIVANSIYGAIMHSKEQEVALTQKTITDAGEDFGNQQMEKVRGVSKMKMVREYLMNKSNESEISDLIAGMSRSSPYVNTFYLFDTRGAQVVVGAQGNPGKLNELADREYVKVALTGQEGYSTAPTKSLVTGKLIVSVTAPVVDSAGKVIGGVGMSYVLDKMIESYITSTTIGKTGFPFILSPKGTVVGHPDQSLLQKDLSQEAGIKSMLDSKKGQGVVTLDGKRKWAVWSQVPGWQWVLVMCVDMSEIEEQAADQRNFMILLGGLAILVLSGASFLALNSIVVRPLKTLEGYAAAIAAGDLDRPLALKSNNEIGKLAASLGTMVESLKTKIGEANEKSRQASEESAKAARATAEANEAREASEHAKRDGMLQAASQLEGIVGVVTTASTELSAQIEQSSRGAKHQADRVTETATAMEEMNASVLEVARSSSQTAEVADLAKSKAVGGANIVGDVVQGMGEVQDHAQNLKSDMDVLGRQASGIGQILNVISDIADQTNLLALNAAIEAARAGEAGRGFAVVADEVRKLAEKTQSATKEVGEAIRGIQEGTRKNVDNVDRAVKAIESTTLLATSAGNALNEIVDLIDTASDQVRAIATASEQQSTTSDEINRAVEQVRNFSSETAQAMDHANQAVGELSNQSHKLRDLIDELKRA